VAADRGHLASRPNNKLYFELANEPNTNFTADKTLTIFAPALAAIRETNRRRPVIYEGASWADVDLLATLNLPDDPNVWPTFHYYAPMDFTHQGADWIDPMYPLGRVYGNQWDKQALIDDPAKVVAFAKRTGKVPFMGETGAYNLIPDSQRAAYHKAVYTAFSRVG
jgi:endoglucanase